MAPKTIGSKRALRRKTDRPRGYKTHEVSHCGSNGRQTSPSDRPLSTWSYSPEELFFTPLLCGIFDPPEVHHHIPLESYSPSSPSGSQYTCPLGTRPPAHSYVADNICTAANDWKPSLSPLSLNQDRLSSLCFYDDPYAALGLSPFHGSKEDIIDASPEEHPWDMGWSTSPDSVDTDLDDESVSSPPTSHLSPESSESDLRHSSSELEDEADDLYRLYPFPVSPDIYPLEESKYPSHLYTPNHDTPLPPSPSPQSQVASTSSLLPPRERESSLPVFHDYLDDAPTIIPCSPSRRTSKELPEDEEDSFGLQLLGTAFPSSSRDAQFDSRQPIPLRSFPGTETDDDLIPAELASKSYIPDPSFVVHTTPPINNASLLLWDPPSTAKIRDANDLPPTRSPPPEDFTLDFNAFAGLEGQEIWEEMRRINELRERTGKTQSWEKERFRELSALLRLKTEMLGNASDNESPPRVDDGKVEDEPAVPPEHEQDLASTEVAPCICTSHSPNGSTTSTVASKDPNDATSPTPGKPPLPKPKITNMAQLVASMVFHRQQDALRRPAARTRTWSGPSYGTNTMQTTSKTHHPPPRSPLRQVSLPCDLECIGREDGDAENAELFESPLPLSPLMLADSPLGWGCKCLQ